jgi:ACS family hexuronate transporter-like MFS transporter
VAVCIWSVAAALHGAMGSLVGFKLVRFLLGLSEPSHLPAAIKVVAEWFPRSERALATGIYKAGSNLGAITVPVLIPWIFHAFGWRATFLITASTGFVWLGFWLWFYRRPTESMRVSAVELAYIQSDPIPSPAPRLPWAGLLRHRETWAYMNFKFMTDAMWHWYGAMFPLYLAQHFGLKLKQFGLPLIVVYLLADAGSVGGGWLSSHLIKRGRSVTYARKLAMFVCCAATVPVMLVGVSDNLWLAIVLVGVAHAAHQGLTANLFTTVSDMFPRNAVGTVIGLGGSAGQVGAALMTVVTGIVLAKWGNFTMLFFVAGSTYLLAWLIFHLVVKRFEPLNLENAAGKVS